MNPVHEATSCAVAACTEILGAGASRRLSAVRWGVAGNILLAWLLTVPGAAAIGAAMELLTRVPGGAMIVFVVMIAIAGVAFTARRAQTRRLAPGLAPQPAYAASRSTAASV